MHQVDENQIIVEVSDISFSYDGTEDSLKDIILAIHQEKNDGRRALPRPARERGVGHLQEGFS